MSFRVDQWERRRGHCLWNMLLIIVRTTAGAGRLLLNICPVILAIVHVSRVSVGHVCHITVHVFTWVTVHKPVSDHTGLLTPKWLLMVS